MFLAAAEHYLGWSRMQIIRGLNENINQSDVLLLYDCAKLLARNYPLQYVLGVAWFCGLKLRVDRRVLIPRPETEELVQLVLGKIHPSARHIFDAATGSGCIALAIKHTRPELRVAACDLSREALQVATGNAHALRLDVEFFRLDLLGDPVPSVYDVIVSNPPYISREESKEMAANVLDFEPEQALFAPGDDPLIFYRKIIDLCHMHLSSNGQLFLELNPLTADEVAAEAKRAGVFHSAEVMHDSSGKKRFFYAVRA